MENSEKREIEVLIVANQRLANEIQRLKTEIEMKNPPGFLDISKASGHPTRAYKSTLTALNNLMTILNRLDAAGALPPNEALTTGLLGGMVAMKLGTLHFPEFAKNGFQNLQGDNE